MALTWFSVSKDNEIKHYDSKTYNIAHIDYKTLDKLILHLEGNEMPLLVTHFDDSRKRPIYVKRIEMPNHHHSFKVVCHILGWQMNVNGENVQSINYVFETVGRVEVEEITTSTGELELKHTPKEMYWIESAGKFDQDRLSWSKEPFPEQLNVIGSKAIHG